MQDYPWWRRWDAERESPDISEATVAAMRAEPGFHAALEYSVRGCLALSDRQPKFHRIISDTASLILGVAALYLDATGGLTHRRLREAAGVTGVLSGGRVSALLMRMQMIGYVVAARDHAPGTPKIYRPTPEMIATFKARFRLDLEALRPMAPDVDGMLERFDTAEGFALFIGALGKDILLAVRHRVPEPEPMLAIGTRRAGAVLMFALLEAAADSAGHFPATGHVSLSVAGLSRRFRVSRTHVTGLLRAMVDAGFFTRGATEGEGEVQPALVEAIERLLAAAFSTVAACAHRGLTVRAAAA